MVDVNDGHEADFLAIAREFSTVLARKEYGRADIVRDEASPMRFYAVRHWASAAAAELCHARHRSAGADGEAVQDRARDARRQRRPAPQSDAAADRHRRMSQEPDRRTGFDRRRENAGPGRRRSAAGRARSAAGPAPAARPAGGDRSGGAARRAREHADAAFSHFKVGAALETADGTVVTGCNIENATYGLTICAERVAMFKALSEGHRAFTRIAIVADTDAPDAALRRLPPDPLGVRRQPATSSSPI